MVGQDNVIKWITSFTLDTLPRTLLIEGRFGSGKHTLATLVSSFYNLPMVEMTEKLDFESINECYLRTEPYLYFIDTTKISVRNQNAILKFLEEPLKNSYIILISENRFNLLPTILNRCVLVSLQPYSKGILKTFIYENNPLLLELTETPGEIQLLRKFDLQREVSYTTLVLESIGDATLFDALNICSHISFDGSQELLNPELFIKVLRYSLTEGLKSGKDFNYAVDLVLSIDKQLKIPNINKKHLFESFIVKLWYSYRKRRK